jgi:predicted flavoprotein YhiN
MIIITTTKTTKRIIVVIGGGAAGYFSAIQCANVIEKSDSRYKSLLYI